jgi:hypothetical protein
VRISKGPIGPKSLRVKFRLPPERHPDNSLKFFLTFGALIYWASFSMWLSWTAFVALTIGRNRRHPLYLWMKILLVAIFQFIAVQNMFYAADRLGVFDELLGIH